MPARCIYIHVPFCEQKCSYCDFFTVRDPSGSHPLAPGWFDLLRREMLLWAEAGDIARDQPLETIYFGGGTPSLTPPAVFAEFLRFVRGEFAVAPDCEVTLEMQPGTADAARFGAYAGAGINRFSLGVQTFHEGHLALTRRRHTVGDSRRMIRDAIATAGADAVSVDLIGAWPGQTVAEWRDDLGRAADTGASHVSAYELTFKDGTDLERAFRSGDLVPCDEDTRIAMFQAAEQTLAAAGLPQYEISNFARPGRESRHNSAYWQLKDYAGLGAGAHGMVWPHRWMNPHDLRGYAAAITAGRLFRQPNDSDDPDVVLAENLHMALRLNRGVNLDDFAARTGRDPRTERPAALASLTEAALVESSGPVLRLTAEGRLRADAVTAAFV